MLIKVTAIRMDGSQLELPLADASSGISVQSIDGLGPVTATIASSDFALRDGAHFHNARRQTRNIVFTLGLEPSLSMGPVRDIRTHLYKFFMPKTNIRLRFFFDNETSVDIWGRVEAFETPMFVRESVATISVICFNPDFFNTTTRNQTMNTTVTGISRTEYYEGSVESGFTLTGTIPRALSSFKVSNTTYDQGLYEMIFNFAFLAGDQLFINTTPGERDVRITRGGTPQSLLYGLDPASRWPLLYPGENVLRLVATGSGFPLTMSWNDKFGGL